MATQSNVEKTTSLRTLLNIKEDDENYYLGVKKTAIKDI